jgi:hypothetical protein
VKGSDGEEAVSSPIWFQRSNPVHLYNPSAYPESVKPGENLTLSFQISNLSTEEASSMIQITNLSGEIYSETVMLEKFESKIVNLQRTVEAHDGVISFFLDSVPYSSIKLNIRSEDSLNVLLDRSHVNYASDRRGKFEALLEENGHKYSTADRIFKEGELNTIDVLIIPLPGAGGSFERLKMLMPQQAEIIKQFVLNGGTLIITGSGDEISSDVLATYNKLIEEMGISNRYEATITGEETELDGILFDGLSDLQGESIDHEYGQGRVFLFPGDPFTDDVIDHNSELIYRLFR